MIDLEKEREALVNEIELFIRESMECFVVEVWADSYASIDSAFSHHITSDGEVFFLREQARQLWEFWKKRAEPAQAEITELKQKLEKLESGEFVLLRKSEFNVFYTDDNQCLDEANIKEFGENCEFGQILEIRKERHIFLDPINLYGTWNKDESEFFIGSRDEAEAMIEAVEKDHE